MELLQTNGDNKIVIFRLEDSSYALHLFDVEKVVQSVQISPLPKAPDKISGIINWHGEIIPVVNVRKLFRLADQSIRLDDMFIIAKTSKRLIVIIVDAILGVYDIDLNQIADASEKFPFVDYLEGITVINDDIVLINDLEKFLSLEEHISLDKILSKKNK